MEPDGRNPFHSQQRTGTTSASPTNGILPGQTHEGVASPTGNPMVYAQAVAGRAPSPTTAGTAETMKRKRGRPRKYGTTSSGDVSAGAKQRKVKALVNVKKNQLVGVGIAGQGFTPHIINIAVGEDVAQKIMLFMQQSKREICILSASGLISSPSLRQPATTGGNITYEGLFEILTLSGFYMRTDLGGTGGLSVCLSSMDNQGQIIGGGVAGPLRAAGPVQVIVGSFLLDNKKEYGAGIRGDSRLASPISSAPVSVGFRSPVESSGRMQALGEDENQNIVGSHFMVQSHGMNLMQARPTDWRVGNDVRSGSTYELAGRTSHGAEESPENGNYDQI